MTSISPSLTALHERDAIVLATQRRREFGEGAIAVDVVLVEHEMMDVDAGEGVARRAVLARFRTSGSVCADEIMSSSMPPAGEFRQREIALGHDGFSGGGNAGQAEARGELAFVHHAAFGEIRILRAMRDQRVEGGGVGERAAQHARLSAIGLSPLVKSTAPASAIRPISVISSPSRCLVSAAAGKMRTPPERSMPRRRTKSIKALIVEHRRGVRHHHHGGDAACRRRAAGGFERLFVLSARFADDDAHVDQAGRDVGAVRVDDLRAVGRAADRADVEDLVGEQDGAVFDLVLGRIDQLGVVDEGGLSHAALRFTATFTCR